MAPNPVFESWLPVIAREKNEEGKIILLDELIAEVFSYFTFPHRNLLKK